MIKLKSLLKEVKETFETFASTRGKGASKIAETAEEKGGLSLLTYEHFKVKEPYYKKAVEGKFDKESAIKEFNETYKKISMNMEQIEFQREVGRLEVLGELLIRDKNNKND
jgi:DNA-binding ferritin-like protein